MREPTPQAAEKRALRADIRQRLAGVPQRMLEAAGQSVSRRLLALAVVRQAATLAAFAATAEEINIDAVVGEKLRQGGKVVLPRYDAEARRYRMVAVADLEADMVCGHFGIREPRPEFPPEDPALLRAADTVWLVPGLAFDARGNRLGHGMGYYDRLLAGVLGPRIGVAQDWQILPQLPVAAHDVAMNMVASEARLLSCQPDDPALQTRKENPCFRVHLHPSPPPPPPLSRS